MVCSRDVERTERSRSYLNNGLHHAQPTSSTTHVRTDANQQIQPQMMVERTRISPIACVSIHVARRPTAATASRCGRNTALNPPTAGGERSWASDKPVSNVPFMMRVQIASTPPDKPIKEVMGSGLFKSARDEWQPRNKPSTTRIPIMSPDLSRQADFNWRQKANLDKIIWRWAGGRNSRWISYQTSKEERA